MRFADFAKKHFPLTHPMSTRRIPKAKKRRKTVSGFQAGDRVQHRNSPGVAPATVLWVRRYQVYVRFTDGSEGSFPASAWVLVN